MPITSTVRPNQFQYTTDVCFKHLPLAITLFLAKGIFRTFIGLYNCHQQKQLQEEMQNTLKEQKCLVQWVLSSTQWSTDWCPESGLQSLPSCSSCCDCESTQYGLSHSWWNGSCYCSHSTSPTGTTFPDSSLIHSNKNSNGCGITTSCYFGCWSTFRKSDQLISNWIYIHFWWHWFVNGTSHSND